jgi:hypothetical protein
VQLSSRQYGHLTDHLLKQIIHNFPAQLSNDLLNALLPLHAQRLVLTKCSHVTVSGIREAISWWVNCLLQWNSEL